MSIRSFALAASAVLVATPVLAAKHRSADPILNHSGPIPYTELVQMDQGSSGYNSRAGKRHMRTAAPVAAAPVASATTASPSVADPAQSVNPPPSDSATPAPAAPPSTTTGQMTTPPGQSAAPTPIPSTPSSPTPPSTPQ